MTVLIKLVLLTCITEVVRGQYNVDGPQRPKISARVLPRQSGKSNSQPPVAVHRFRRPIALKSTRPTPTENNDFPSYTALRSKASFVPVIKSENPSTPPPQLLQQDQPVKPVSEETKEEDEDVNQALVKLGQVLPTYPQPSNNFVPSSSFTPRPEPIIPYRPSAPAPRPSSHFQDEVIAPVQYRPQKPIKFRKPVEDVPEVRVPVKQQSFIRQSPGKAEYREKKPVAQIIRRWREDNEDGSITWGFENDDGSYKEEIIGVDCVTRGKYGYVDPDGIRREYTYETGIKCDEEQQQEDENGFVDYQENKLVLPNGKTIDLSSMGKKQARRPQFIYRN